MRRVALSYRPEIDGLRAIAILPVVLYHAGAPGFGGGFIGVDVFFAISGYLITRIIVAALTEDRYRFSAFYERRARRILPALFPVLLFSALSGWLLLTPDDFRQFSQSLAATALFGSNFLFAHKTDYFYTGEGLRFLIHGWSLSVEEQFYLLFPAGLVALWKCRKSAVLPVVLAMLAGSLVLAVLAATHSPPLAFFMLPTRMWELMAGAACALLPRPAGGRPLAALAGIAMIAAGVALIDSETPVPGLWFLLPVGGTALVLLFAAPENLAGKALGFRPLVLLGLVSYGLYLWHQPILAVLRYVWLGALPLDLTVGALFLSLMLASLSWRYLEQPVRGRTLLSSRRSLAALCTGCLALAAMVGAAGHFRVLGARSTPATERLGAVYGGMDTPDVLVPNGKALPFILYGDSHARQYFPTLAERFGHGAIVSRDGCLSLPGLTNWPPGSEGRAGCTAHFDALARVIRKHKFLRVIVAQRWDREMWSASSGVALGETSGRGGPALVSGLEALRRRLPPDVELVLIGNAPTAWAAGEHMTGGFPRCQAYINTACPASYPANLAEGRKVNAALRQFANDGANTAYIDAAAPLCPDGRCRIVAGGRLYYSDGSHLTPLAARMVIAQLTAPALPPLLPAPLP